MDKIKRWGLLCFLLILLGLFFHFKLYAYLSFEQLKTHRAFLVAWTQTHLILALLFSALIYIVAVAASIPGAWFLTLITGFLFGPILGTLVVVFSATMGAFLVYLAVKFALRDWVAQKTTKWLKLMEKGFQENAFAYLFFLRLVPVFPFWLINIIPALLGISVRTFIAATFLGIIPGSFIYVLVGNSLGHVFDTNQPPNLEILKDPILFLPLIALGLLTLLPILYRRFKQNKT
jgi:uncharacterized membrane protein YdjX (TVP38/TMEM64 family)